MLHITSTGGKLRGCVNKALIKPGKPTRAASDPSPRHTVVEARRARLSQLVPYTLPYTT